MNPWRKHALALLVALMMALSGFALAEAPEAYIGDTPALELVEALPEESTVELGEAAAVDLEEPLEALPEEHAVELDAFPGEADTLTDLDAASAPEEEMASDGSLVIVNNWTDLYNSLMRTDELTIKLGSDITGGNQDRRLNVFGGRITLDLNGHTLDYDGHKPDYSGTVNNRQALIEIYGGDLTLTDSSSGKEGKLWYTASQNSPIDCVVYVNGGSFTMEDGTIDKCGNGVTINNQYSPFTMKGGKITGQSNSGVLFGFYGAGPFAMKGGEISGNTGVGVKLADIGSITLSGGKIINNTKDVVLGSGKTITIDGTLSEGTEVGVYCEGTLPATLTSGLNHQDPSFITLENESESGTRNVVTLNGDGEAVWSAIPLYEVHAVTNLHGKVTTNVDSAAKGDTIIVTATPYEGYELDTLLWGDQQVIQTPVTGGTFEMPECHVWVQATFKKRTYTVDCGEAENGTVTANPASATMGDTITLTLEPAVGYEPDTLTVKDAKNNDINVTMDNIFTYTFTMPASDVNVTATFNKRLYFVSVKKAQNGTVTADELFPTMDDTVKLTVVPAKNYLLDTLTVKDADNNEITVTDNSFKMPASDVTVTATFIKGVYNVAVSAAVNGTVSTDKTSAWIGETVTLTTEPAEGYALDTLTVKDAAGNDIAVTDNTFTMPAGDVTVSATFITVWERLKADLEGTEGADTITLTSDIARPDGIDENPILITRKVTLDLNGHTLDGGNSQGALIYVDDSGDLTLKDTSENGKIIFPNASAESTYAVTVSNGGQFTLLSGTISGRNGVGVYDEGSTFTMEGGTISGNTQAGVELWKGGAFTMNGGTISGNTGAGVSLGQRPGDAGGQFTLNGGTITGNGGSGVYFYAGTFILNSGVVTENTYGSGDDLVTSNVYMVNTTITIGDSLDNTSATKIGVYVPYVGSRPITITDGLNARPVNFDFSIDSKRGDRGYTWSMVDGEVQIGPVYEVKIMTPGAGKVTPDPRFAEIGETVSLTVTTEDGFTLKSLTATDADGNDVPVTNNSFTMPASVVTVKASYAHLYTVTFEANGATGTMEPVSVVSGDEYILPECGFAAPENMVFEGWLVGETILQAGERVTIEENTTIKALWGVSVPTFRTHSLLLNGEIGVNFFMELPEIEGVDYENSYMVFTVQSKNGKTTRDDYDPDYTDVNGNGYYGFTVNLNAVQMASPIHAVFHYGDGQTVEQTYTVKDYILAYDDVADRFDAVTTKLIHALADYGHYAQPPLADYNGWTVGKDYAEMDVYYTEDLDVDSAYAAVADQSMKTDMGTSEVDKFNYTLNLLTQTEMRVIVALQSGYKGTATYQLDGQPVQAEPYSGGRYIVRINNIPAHRLDDVHTVAVTTKSGTATATLSPLTYVRWFLKDSRRMYQESVAALYYYYQAAEDYRAVHPQE